jgi:hypothetical protein
MSLALGNKQQFDVTPKWPRFCGTAVIAAASFTAAVEFTVSSHIFYGAFHFPSTRKGKNNGRNQCRIGLALMSYSV